jgi:phage shock protein A
MAKGVFARMTDIIKSNINELLDRAEEPDKMIRQMVREMEEAVSKATASVGTAVANQKRLERQHNEKLSQSDDWQRKAERAVETGQDDLARRALERKSVFSRAAEDLRAPLEDSRETAEQLREQLRELKTKLEEARTREGTLVARHQAAEARKRLAKSLSGLGSDAFSSFERFEQRVETTEAEADAHTEVAGEMESIERKIRDLDKGTEIEDELARLKAKMSTDANS